MTKLYLISPPNFELEEMKLKLEEAFKGGEISVFQLRMKSLSPDGTYNSKPEEKLVRKAVAELLPICHKNKCVFILNDNPKLASELNCDGVHIGEDDGNAKEAKKIMGEGKYVGVSCYASLDRAYKAGEEGADYVAFGAFYETQTKKPKGRPTLELLDFWQKYTNIPSVAIGGIKVENAEPIIKAGADFIAVVTGVWDYKKGVKQAIADFNKLFV
ncbi:MAG: thiamine phosphate synthase [Rickettsiales bacterium]|nr:thiamine phosphate synthase [Rickettsiales bacterium]